MTTKPLILIVNDDGIHARGIHHLEKALVGHGELVVVAPDSDQSCIGMGVTLKHPLYITPQEWEGETKAWKINGTPADCVKLASRKILNRKPDLIVSGINKGSNAGRNIFYSGTIGGVIEGALRGIPGIAFSCYKYESPNYARIEKYILPIVKFMLDHPLPTGTFLNVTLPCHLEEIKGIKLVKHGQGFWTDDIDERAHPEGGTYYWMGGKEAILEEEEQTDVSLIHQGFVTVVPVQVRELTDMATLESHSEKLEAYSPVLV